MAVLLDCVGNPASDTIMFRARLDDKADALQPSISAIKTSPSFVPVARRRRAANPDEKKGGAPEAPPLFLAVSCTIANSAIPIYTQRRLWDVVRVHPSFAPSGEPAMLDEFEFVLDWFAEVQDQGAPGRLRQVAFRKGKRLRAEVRPVEDGNGQLADLRLADGTTALRVPLSRFVRVDQNLRAA
jgi:hypothetical protein